MKVLDMMMVRDADYFKIRPTHNLAGKKNSQMLFFEGFLRLLRPNLNLGFPKKR